MSNTIQDRADRRVIILEGMNKGLTNDTIAENLGVSPIVIRKDLNRMRKRKDPELREAKRNAEEIVLDKREKKANRPNERFQESTGMTFQEKTFQNMMTFYGPEIKKILRAAVESDEIRKLPNSARKAMKRNGIIAQGWRTPEITSKARNYLTSQKFS